MQVIPATRRKEYEELKKALLDVFGLTKQQRASKLLHLPGLGDKKPSKLAAEIVALVPDDEKPGYLEQQIFLDQLPTAVQQLMLSHKMEHDLYQLGKLADDYMMTMRGRWTSSAVAARDSMPALGAAMSPNAAEGGSSCAAATMPQFTGYSGKKWFCWRHAQYGPRATNCEDTKKCQWRMPQGSGARPQRGNSKAGHR